MDRLSIVGLGRFGAALAGLCHERGIQVRAWDPAPRESSPFLVGTLGDLLSDPVLLVLAVPVQGMDALLAQLAPQLRAGHWVMDVASVKVHSVEVLRRHLGERVPW